MIVQPHWLVYPQLYRDEVGLLLVTTPNHVFELPLDIAADSLLLHASRYRHEREIVANPAAEVIDVEDAKYSRLVLLALSLYRT